ncbi:MAG: tetratricopeptide repeat protein [Myxococcota bacterium]|nr:tetratricopeptide repeat protein [Myxococcota bacterium]
MKASKKLASEGNLSGALEKSQEAIQADATLTEAYLLLGSLLDVSGHSGKAIEVYNKGLTRAKNPGALHHSIGLIYLEKNQTDKALSALLSANELVKPPGADLKADVAYAYLLLGNYDLGLRFSKQAIDLNPKSFAAQYTYGETLFRAEKFDEASDAFKRASVISPNEVSAQRRQAQALQKIGKLSQAKAILEKITSQNPKDIKSLILFAGILVELKDYSSATSTMEAAVNLAPKNVQVLKLLAHTYQQAGQKKKADQTNKKIRKLEKSR